MRDGAGTTTTNDPASTLSAELVPPTTPVQRCKGCGSHFCQDFEEPLCAACVEWRELYQQTLIHAAAVGPRRR
jgi:hypothetical protein